MTMQQQQQQQQQQHYADDNDFSGQAARMHGDPRSTVPSDGVSPLLSFPPTPTVSPFPTSRISTTPKETPRAAAAFQEYCLMGPERSYPKVVEKLGRKTGYTRVIEHWASLYHWQDRVRQYDAQEAEKRRVKRQQELEKMDEEHSLIGRTHLLRAVSAMEPILKAGEAPFPSLVSLFKYSAELERLARGAATSRLEGDVSIVVQPKEYINLSPDECGSEE